MYIAYVCLSPRASNVRVPLFVTLGVQKSGRNDRVRAPLSSLSCWAPINFVLLHYPTPSHSQSLPHHAQARSGSGPSLWRALALPILPQKHHFYTAKNTPNGARACNVFLCPEAHFKVHCVALDKQNTDTLRIRFDDAVYVDVKLREVGDDVTCCDCKKFY
jgi:hypothetical protein